MLNFVSPLGRKMETCYHCHGSCELEIHYDDKVFCCDGCKTVYEILNTGDLKAYYSIDKNPGIKAGGNYVGKFNFLDLEEFRSRLITFHEGDITRIKFFIPQIHCSSCLWLLERLSKLNEGVIQSQVNFTTREVEITFNEQKISLRQLAELLATIGYPPSVTNDEINPDRKKKRDFRLITQIGVVGFCFGNMMLLSFPEYLGLDETDGDFSTVFNYLNLGLSIPVMLFGAKDYLVSAYKSLRAKYINIDVPISLGILAFYLQSLYEILTGSGPGYLDSFAGLIFFLLVGKWFQQTTYGAMNFERDYKSYFPVAVTKVESGTEKIVPLREIKIGDRLLIRGQELIPADGVLIRGEGRIDYSFVSGESVPIHKMSGDKVFAGGRQTGQLIEIEVLKEVENSYLTKLWNNPVFDKEKLNTSFTETVTKYFTIGILLLATGGAIYWGITDPSRWLFVIVSVLIIACPCAIALSVPFTYGNGIRILGRNGAYLRSSKVIETVTEVTDLVFDKTGTITLNNESEISWEGEELTEKFKEVIADMTGQSSHPLSRSVNRYLGSTNKRNLAGHFEELPGLGLMLKTETHTYKLGSSSWLGISAEYLGTRVYFAVDDKIQGAFVLSNVYRPGMSELFKNMGNKYRIHILSGDNEAERERLSQLLPGCENMYFNQKPEDKMEYVNQLQKKGKKVMMLGDGLNDAGALKQSNVGVSVVDDLYSFSPSSDIILDGQKMKHLQKVMDYCSFNKKVVKLSYAFSIFYNVIGLSYALTGTLTPLVAAVLMPMSSISVVLMVTLMTNLRGIKLGRELNQ